MLVVDSEQMSASFQHQAPPEFSVGECVRVIAAESWGHCRTPSYLRGQIGLILKRQGDFRNPESLAYGGLGLPALPLYLVEFNQTEIWSNYQGSPRDKLWADIYHHWLEPVTEARGTE